jgi:hypothetical protein
MCQATVTCADHNGTPLHCVRLGGHPGWHQDGYHHWDDAGAITHL